MASAYSVTHKCLVPVGGVPMLSRVVASLMACADIGPIAISIDDRGVAAEALGGLLMQCEIVPTQASAARSAISWLRRSCASPPASSGLARTPPSACTRRAASAGETSSHTTMSEWEDFTESPAARSGTLAFERAGVAPDEIDVCEIYDAFTPISGMRTAAGGRMKIRQASFDQPNGINLPFRSAIQPLMSGSDTAMAAGWPRYSAMAM